MIALGIQKYFILAAILVAAGLAISTVSYRSAYLTEQATRIAVEENLARTVAAYDEAARSSRLALDAVTRATAHSRSLDAQRLLTRERVLTTPDDQDGPIAPILRDAVNSVR